MNVRSSTGTTPYNLVYGTHAIMPLELEIPTLRIAFQELIDDATYKEQQLQQLEMLDEKRFNALEHLEERYLCIHNMGS